MSYADRLKAEIWRKGATRSTDKTAETRCGSFGGDLAGHSVEAELADHLIRLLPGADHRDYAEALALALANPKPHLESFRIAKPWVAR